VDRHARSLFLVILDRDGQECFARNLPAAPGPFLKAVQPFRDGLVVGCEGMPCWYGLADTCRDAHLTFALGHAWAMKAVHGSKTKCDRHDAQAIAQLLKGGNFPPAYAYPKERRGRRARLRARLRLVRQRAELYRHVHTARRQANLPPVSNDVTSTPKRGGITAGVRRSVGCGSPGPSGPGAAPVADSKPDRQGRVLRTAAVTPEKRRQGKAPLPVAVENIFS
jgi:hypothetical protein